MSRFLMGFLSFLVMMFSNVRAFALQSECRDKVYQKSQTQASSTELENCLKKQLQTKKNELVRPLQNIRADQSVSSPEVSQGQRLKGRVRSAGSPRKTVPIAIPTRKEPESKRPRIDYN